MAYNAKRKLCVNTSDEGNPELGAPAAASAAAAASVSEQVSDSSTSFTELALAAAQAASLGARKAIATLPSSEPPSVLGDAVKLLQLQADMLLSLLASHAEVSGTASRRPVATPHRASLTCEEQAQKQEQRPAQSSTARKGARQATQPMDHRLERPLQGHQEADEKEDAVAASGAASSTEPSTVPSAASGAGPSTAVSSSPRVASDVSTQPPAALFGGALRGRNAMKCDVRIELGKGQQMRVRDGKGFISKQGLVLHEHAAGTMGFCREVELSPSSVQEVRDRFVSDGKATFLVDEDGFGAVTVMVSKADPELLAPLVRALKPATRVSSELPQQR